MPTIRTTFAGLPVEAEYDYVEWYNEYELVTLFVGEVNITENANPDLLDHLDQLFAESRAQWDADERRATRELERGE